MKATQEKTALITGLLDELEKIGFNVGDHTEAITDALGAPGAAIGQYMSTHSKKDAFKALSGSLAATAAGVGIERAASPWTDRLAKSHPGTAAALRFGLIAAPEAVNIAMMARRRAAGRVKLGSVSEYMLLKTLKNAPMIYSEKKRIEKVPERLRRYQTALQENMPAGAVELEG